MEDFGKLYAGNSLEILKEIKSESVHCIITSPPYYKLRKEKIEPSLWGDGTRYVLGQEPIPELYISHLTEIFNECKRILRNDGILWINIGDTYAGNKIKNEDYHISRKSLCAIPQRLILSLINDGFIYRTDIIWKKTSISPESASDRPTRSHEYILMFTKSEDYFTDMDSVRTPHKEISILRTKYNYKYDYVNERLEENSKCVIGTRSLNAIGSNIRSIWEFTTQTGTKKHFSAFPEVLPETCIKISTSPIGCCEKCGNQIMRIVSNEKADMDYNWSPELIQKYTKGFLKMCSCESGIIPSTVLDLFCGSGTTCVMAKKLGRGYVGIDVSQEYINETERRLLQIKTEITTKTY